MKSKYTLMAEMFKALGDENRLKLMEELKDGEKNAGELLDKLSVTQPTLSHHMKILCDSGIVDSRKDGKWTYYRISEEGIGELLDIIGSFTASRRKPSFRIEDIVIQEEKKEAENKKETVKEILTPSQTVEEDMLWEDINDTEETISEEIEQLRKKQTEVCLRGCFDRGKKAADAAFFHYNL